MSKSKDVKCPECDTEWLNDMRYKAHYVNNHERPWPWELSDYSEPFRKNALRARERDDFECQWCQDIDNSEHIEAYSRGLDAHHIVRPDEFTNAEDAHAMSNLVTLCRPCHRAIEQLDVWQVEQVLSLE